MCCSEQLTKNLLETSLNEEMTEHLGYEEHVTPDSETEHPQRHPI